MSKGVSVTIVHTPAVVATRTHVVFSVLISAAHMVEAGHQIVLQANNVHHIVSNGQTKVVLKGVYIDFG